MGDSATDPKLEDVLSSVRRLVSQELPKRAEPKSAPSGDGALVLTSKERITSDPKARVETRSLEQRIAELEAAVDSASLEFEPDGSEDQTLHRPDRIVYTRPRSSEREAERSHSTLRLSEIALIDTGSAETPADEDEAKVEFRHGAHSREVVPEAPMAEDVPTMPAASAELHAFSDPDDVVARIEARIERGGDPLDESIAPASPVDQKTDDDDTASFETALSAAVSASLASAKVADADEIADDADTLAPEEISDPKTGEPNGEETPAQSAIAGPAEATRLAVPENPSAADDEDVPAEDEAAVLEAADDDARETTADTPERAAAQALDALPDEDAMRLLVGRLIREELRGELGERITRNVRKLVRREIMHVLETRSLD